MTAFLFSPTGNLHIISPSDNWKTENLFNLVPEATGIQKSDVYLLLNGHLIQPGNEDTMAIASNDVLRVQFRLPGGKGGFGSMLRAIGAQIEKTTSREACRDLSGRRMRDVNDEKKITEWVANQADKEREVAKQKQERLERRRAVPKHNFDDRTYTKQIQENSQKIDDALKQGLKVCTSASSTVTGSKRPGKGRKEATKKRRMWMDMDTENSDECDEEEKQEIPFDAPSTSTCVSDNCAPSTSQIQETTTEICLPDESTQEGKIKSEHTKEPQSNVIITTSLEIKSEPATEKSENIKREDNTCDKNTKDDTPVETKPFCIDDYNTAEELESIGLEQLKDHLKVMGLKCGGTLQERAQRLFLTKGKALEDLDPSLFAKPAKGKKSNKSKKH